MIHIIFSGYGYLVGVVVFGFSFVANLGTNVLTGDGKYWDAHKWPFALSLMASAMMCMILGFLLHNHKARHLVDTETGEEVVLRPSHTLFFIPMLWWGPILFVGGIVVLVLEFVK
jgi:hypothetical protein